MFDPTLLKSTDLSSHIEPENDLGLRSSQQSLDSSVKMVTSHLKRDLSPSSYSWRKSTRLKATPETKEKGSLSPELDPLPPKIGCPGPLAELLQVKAQTPDQETMDPLSQGRLLQSLETKSQRSDENSMHQTCLGINDKDSESLPRTPVVPSQQSSSGSSTATSNLPNYLSSLRQKPLEESPCLNGNIFSREKQLISTKSSCRSIALHLIRRERLASETLKSVLAELKRSGRWRQVLSGLRPGDPLRERLLLYLNIENESYQSMAITSSDYLQRNELAPMDKSSSSTRESEMKSEEGKQFCSPIITTSHRYTQQPCKTTESNIVDLDKVEAGVLPDQEKFASGSTVKLDVGSRTQLASTDMCVEPVGKPAMENRRAERGIEDSLFGTRPKYLRHNLWTPYSDPRSPAAEWTLSAQPLPQPPQIESENLLAQQTLNEKPELFKIVTPINIETLEQLSIHHPNRPFVESILEGFRNGFWPWATTVREGYPLTHNESKQIQLTPEKETFLLEQIKHEQELGRMSSDFGEELLPGMFCMPHYVVPKPHGDGWRLVNDLSAGSFSLNSMVDHQYVTGYPLDNLSQFGDLLLRKRKETPGVN
jgi:hypothetical protein